MLYASMGMQGIVMYQLLLTDYIIWQIVMAKSFLEVSNGLADSSAAYISSVSDLMSGDIH